MMYRNFRIQSEIKQIFFFSLWGVAVKLFYLSSSTLKNDINTHKSNNEIQAIWPLAIFEKMASNDSLIGRRSIIVADELFTLLQQWKIQTESNGDDPKMFVLVDFVIKESSRPADVIRALILWSSSNQFGDSLLPRLEDLLCRGIHFSTLNGELSGTLLRLKHARTMFKELASIPVDQQEEKMQSSTFVMMLSCLMTYAINSRTFSEILSQ